MSIDTDILADFDATRDFSAKGFRSLCYAPYTSLYFDTRGDVRVCCHNWAHSVGNVATDTIAEIWKGAKIAAIREAVRDYNFERGCSFCEWQIGSRNFVNLAISKWDRLPVAGPDPPWPLQMEFSISNTCNLECVMCNGTASSSIRARREKQPPLPSPYSDSFFEELRAYLPHLKVARFLGGEPFLQQECFRIWDMLIEDGIQLPCHVTTNGTIFNARVQRVLEALQIGIAVSLDGITKQTIESIRINARYESLMGNLAKFRAYADDKKTSFALTFCLMRQNWHELGDFCLFADGLGCSVFVNSVRRPPEMSLYTLSPAELARIVEKMERQEATQLANLRKNRGVWESQVRLLRNSASGAVSVPDLGTGGQAAGHRRVESDGQPARNSKGARQSRLFVYSICGEAHSRLVNLSLRFLKRFTRHDVLVVTARSTSPIDHDQVLRLEAGGEYDDRRASILIKTNLHRLIGDRAGCCCYLDSDVVAVHSQIDAIFKLKSGPVTFAPDHVTMRKFSRWAVNCDCTANECDHLKAAIKSKFDVEIDEPSWQHWNGGVFLFDSESSDFMNTWHDYTRQIFADPAWKTRDQGTLIATVWKHGLQHQPMLPDAYNYIVDPMHGVAARKRPSLQAPDYSVDLSYSLCGGSDLMHPRFLHFINGAMGARGWKNWDDVEALLT